MERSVLLLLIYAMTLCAVVAAAQQAPEVGPAELVHQPGGFEACAFTGPQAPGGISLIASRFNEASFSWELLQIALDGSDPKIVGFGRSPDARGSMIAWVGTEPGSEGIWLRDLATDSPAQRLTSSLSMLHPSIAPDGRRVACTQRTPNRDGIFFLEEGQRRPQVISNRNERNPAWGPRDDLMLAIKTDQLWLLHSTRWEHMEQTRLTDGGMLHFDPAWSQCGEWVAFAAGWTRQQARVSLMHLQTREIHPVAPGITGVRSPAIAPDGSMIAFAAGEGEEAAVYLCRLRLR